MIEYRQKAPGLAAQDMQPKIVAVEGRVGLPQTRSVAVALDAAFACRGALEIAFDVAGKRHSRVHPALRQQTEPRLMRAEVKFR
jgi:hypothetical protein